MKGILIFLIIVGLLVVCGGVAAVLFFIPTQVQTIPIPPAVDLAATPTLAAGLPPVEPTIPPAATLPPIGGGSNPTTSGFQGTFAGTLNGDNGSSAPVTLELSQSGNTVTGNLTLGEGLIIDGGNCGAQAAPAGSRSATGEVDPANPNHLGAVANFDVQGLTVGVNLSADLSPDGNTLTTQIGLDLPFICGRDPALSGALVRQ
jgi:hypothetical protein